MTMFLIKTLNVVRSNFQKVLTMLITLKWVSGETSTEKSRIWNYIRGSLGVVDIHDKMRNINYSGLAV